MCDPQQPPTPGDEVRRRYAAEQGRHGQGDEGDRSAPRDWSSLVEEQIQKLDLDNLPGKGKPLDLSENPYARPEDRLANRLLRNAGFTLPWIQDGKEIDARLERARARLLRAWERHRELMDTQICAGHQWVEGEWQAALREFKGEVAEINRQIRDFNLKVTAPGLQRFSIQVDEELARLGIAD